MSLSLGTGEKTKNKNVCKLDHKDTHRYKKSVRACTQVWRVSHPYTVAQVAFKCPIFLPLPPEG